MKKIVVNVTTGQSEAVRKIFDKLKLPVVFSKGVQDDIDVIVFSALLPDDLVDEAIGDLTEILDLRVKENVISVLEVEAFVSTALDRIKEKVARKSPQRNPLERLVSETDRFVRSDKDIFLMAMFAAIVAFAGLMLDNVVILIGAMLLSPMLGQLNAFAVNANLGRLRKMMLSQIWIFGILGSIISISTITTLIVSMFTPIPLDSSQIFIRSSTSFFDIIIALVLGLAGGLALFAAIPELLVGVAIAVALVPPATIVGIGLALNQSSLFVGAFVLMLVYLIGLEFGSTVMLRVRGVSPRRYYQKKEAKRESAYSMIVLAALFIILIAVVFILNS